MMAKFFNMTLDDVVSFNKWCGDTGADGEVPKFSFPENLDFNDEGEKIFVHLGEFFSDDVVLIGLVVSDGVISK